MAGATRAAEKDGDATGRAGDADDELISTTLDSQRASPA
jgi:hypothetical protein